MSNETNFLRNDERTDAVYDFIVAYKSKHDGNSPTIREIGVACEISSTAVVSYHLGKLHTEGRIELIRGEIGKSRMISVPGYEWVKVSE